MRAQSTGFVASLRFLFLENDGCCGKLWESPLLQKHGLSALRLSLEPTA
jgi:hypothetical protein